MPKIEIANVETVSVASGRYVYLTDGREYHVYRYRSHGVETVSVVSVWDLGNGRRRSRSVTGTKTASDLLAKLADYEKPNAELHLHRANRKAERVAREIAQRASDYVQDAVRRAGVE